jgi:hypothetical protein
LNAGVTWFPLPDQDRVLVPAAGGGADTVWVTVGPGTWTVSVTVGPGTCVLPCQRVTNQPLLAIEVDGFACHENRPDQQARDALKVEILDAHQMPLLRLRTTGSGEDRRIRQALDDAEANWARLSTR